MSQIDDIINEIVKYVGRAGGLLIILDRAEHALASQLSEPVGKGGVAKFYVDGMKVKEVKYEEYWETEYKISSALDRLGLMVEICDAGRDSSAIFSWRREALTLEEEEERFEWVREKLKENGIEWSENRIRTLIGLKPRMQILVHIPLVLGSPTLGTEKRKVKGTISLQIINEKTSIKVTEVPKTFGREDFRNIIKDSLLKCISGKHFTIDYDFIEDTFVIWDEGSLNGTYLNGVDIRGKGRQQLKNNDTISLANALNIKFVFEGNISKGRQTHKDP